MQRIDNKANPVEVKVKIAFKAAKKDVIKNRYLYVMLIPVVSYYVIFHYIPMYGAQIAFKEFMPMRGIAGSPWVGWANFQDFFQSFYFKRVVTNTLLLSFTNIIFGFPAPIILALLLNEVRNNLFKRTAQTVTYLPHFISLVVVCGLILDFTSTEGLINDILATFGIKAIPFMTRPVWFRPIYVITDIWQEVGWGSIIYLAALSAIDPEQYEACKIDGGGRFRQLLSITLPGITPTIIILLLLRLGRIMNIGSEKILLLFNELNAESADIIASFVYRRGLIDMNFSYSSAVGLFNSIINLTFLVVLNKISRKLSETSLW